MRPTAHIISEVQVLVGGEASAPVSEPNCVAMRRGGEQGEEKSVARRSTNVIRSDEQASRRAKVKPSTGHGAVVCDEGEPVKAHTLVIGRLTTGRWEVGVRGLGISVCISAGSPRADRRQRRHSTVEAGESRWREGRQGIGMPR